MKKEEVYKYSFKLERKTASLYVQNTGRQQCAPRYSWGPGIRDHYLIHHVLSGKGCLVVGEERWSLSKGDTFLTYPDTPILYYADEQDPWEYVWVGFYGSDARKLVEQTAFAPARPVLHAYFPDEIARMLLDLCGEYGTAPWCGPAMTGQLYRFLAFLIERAQCLSGGAAVREDCAETAAHYIMNHYEQPITIAALADLTAVSQSSLYRSFKARFHVSPKQFLNSYRIERASFLLTNSVYSIREISNSVGFDDPLYFSRAFKRLKGISPRAFAERYGARPREE